MKPFHETVVQRVLTNRLLERFHRGLRPPIHPCKASTNGFVKRLLKEFIERMTQTVAQRVAQRVHRTVYKTVSSKELLKEFIERMTQTVSSKELLKEFIERMTQTVSSKELLKEFIERMTQTVSSKELLKEFIERMTQTVAQRVSRNGGTQGTFAMTYTSCKEYTSGSTNSCAPSLDETHFPISHSFPYRRVLQRRATQGRLGQGV
jgi:uncharacterized protein YdiU (UPF0061 family)